MSETGGVLFQVGVALLKTRNINDILTYSADTLISDTFRGIHTFILLAPLLSHV
jgi:hypothetical protein